MYELNKKISLDGAGLRSLRMSFGITQLEFAKSIGVSYSVYSKLGIRR